MEVSIANYIANCSKKIGALTRFTKAELISRYSNGA